MDATHFLLYKKKLNSNLSCNESILTSFDELLDKLTQILYSDTSKNDKIINEIVQIKEIKNTYICKKDTIEQQIITCDNKIYNLCSHEFIEDYIDVTPDISKKIIYCTICELSKREKTPLSRL
jgi:hypothetical protein